MRQKILLILIPFIIRAMVRVIAITCRVRVLCESGEAGTHPRNKQQGTGRLYAFWHGQLLFATFPFRGAGVYGIVSLSRDGEYMARILHGWGFRLIRGSSSRNSMGVYRDSLRALQGGGDIGMAPDGPRGPYRHVNPGVVRMAAVTGCALYPVGCGYSRSVRLKSWDRFQIPLPFSRIVILFDAPLRVGARTDDAAALAVAGEELAARITAVTDRAQRMADA
ncbi:MAG: lysophospholipid acyltransferase family protein [Fibrobacterota bacterium]